MTTTPGTKNMVAMQALTGRLEPFLINRIDPQRASFTTRQTAPQLSWNRLDLAIKMIYLQSLAGQKSDFAEEIYDAHIRSFSLGDMSEPGNPEKIGVEKFRADFAGLAEAMAETGFDADQSLVPVASDGSILNGAHRTACALHFGHDMTIVETGLEPVRYDHTFFRRRGFAEEYLDAAALKYAELSLQTSVALLWPAAKGREDDVEKIIGPLVYKKSIRLGTNGAHNLLSQVYAGEPWLGDAAANFPGITNKLTECFSGSAPLRILLFDSPPDRDLIAMKEEIRALFGIGKHSIHVTDAHQEALDIARLLINPCSVRFLDRAQPNRFPVVAKMVENFKSHLTNKGVSTDAVAAESGIVLGAYGVRTPGDVDFLSPLPIASVGMFEHHAPDRYNQPLTDLLQNPANHFHYWGLRFISLDLVADMKRRRNDGRDMEDLANIQPLLAMKSERRQLRTLIYKARFAYSRIRRFGIKILMKLGLDSPIREFVRSRRN